MAVVKWIFEDASTSETYVWPINPSAGSFLPRNKRLAYQSSVIPGGHLNVFEGRPEPVASTCSGTTLDEAQYRTLLGWAERHRLLYLTDDLGRRQTVYVRNLTFKRVRTPLYPWHHEYNMEFVVVS